MRQVYGHTVLYYCTSYKTPYLYIAARYRSMYSVVLRYSIGTGS